MDQLLQKFRQRADLASAQMVAGAVRNKFMSDPQGTMDALAHWTEHPEDMVRIAAGCSLGAITIRNPDALPVVMPWVERLANDQSPEVRMHGAVGALEMIWLHHYDEIWLLIEDWIERRNDLVKKAALLTMSRIVETGKLSRPSTLKQLIERGTAMVDRLLSSGSPDLRPTLAEVMNQFGLRAPDLIGPWVEEWANRSDLNALALAREILELRFGEYCRKIDKNLLLTRMAELEEELLVRISGWLRQGEGRVEYFTILADRMLTRSGSGDTVSHWADPYRGCQFLCEFCATRHLSEYAGDSPENLVRRVEIVANAAEVLARELGASEWKSRPDRVIRIGHRSDPYQAAEERFQLTREMLKICLDRGNPVVVQTRSELVLRDLDVLEKLGEAGLVNVIVSVPTPIEGIRKKLEVGVPTVNDRLRAISMLAKKCIPVGLGLSPLFPHLTDHPEAIEELIRRASEAGAGFVVPEVLTLEGTARAKARYFLTSFIPDLLPRFTELYSASPGGRHPDGEFVRGLVEELIPSLAEKYGMDREGMRLGAASVVGA
ncbi:MAG: radical SAM protein [Planctomycetota bacterium]